MRKLISMAVKVTIMLAVFGVCQAGVLVTDLKGKAETEGKKPVAVLSEIADGGLLDLAAGAQLVATDLASGREYVLVGAGRFRVGKNGVEGLLGASVTPRALPAANLPNVKVAVARVAQATLTMRGGAFSSGGPGPLSPARTAVLGTAPTLRWSPVEGANSYRVTLADEGGKTIFEADTKDSELTLQTKAGLGAGKQYSWRVAAHGANGRLADASTIFSVVPDDLVKLLAQIKPDKDAPHSRWVLYAAQLQEAGAADEARLIWQMLAKERPEDPNLAKLVR